MLRFVATGDGTKKKLGDVGMKRKNEFEEKSFFSRLEKFKASDCFICS